MSHSYYEACAEVAAYASYISPFDNGRTFELLGLVAAGEIAPADMPAAARHLPQLPGIEGLDGWVQTPDGAAQVAARVGLQADYDTSYRQPIRQRVASSRGDFDTPGNHFLPFDLVVAGEPTVAKFAIAGAQPRQARQIEAATQPLLVAKELHPKLEQVRGISFSAGALATREIPGHYPHRMPLDELAALTDDQLIEAFTALDVAGRNRLAVDYQGYNSKVSAAEGFGFYDLLLDHLTPPRQIAWRNARYFIDITLQYAAVQTDGKAGREVRSRVMARATDIFHGSAHGTSQAAA
jgi:hypothetical protein